jgi:hypothetical protein
MTSSLAAVGTQLPLQGTAHHDTAVNHGTVPHRDAAARHDSAPHRDSAPYRDSAPRRDTVAHHDIARPPRRPATALTLLESARRGLAEAEQERDPGTRYICAHLAALRAAAAIVSVRGEPGTGVRRHRPRSVWELLPQVEPALREWAAFFAASAAKRAAAEAGLRQAVSASEADDLLRDAAVFLDVAERAIGVGSQPELPFRTAS